LTAEYTESKRVLRNKADKALIFNRISDRADGLSKRWISLVWFGLVWFGLFGLVWFGLVWFSLG